MDQIAAQRILAVGDLVLDRYCYGDVNRISPESPVQVVHVHREEKRLGGAIPGSVEDMRILQHYGYALVIVTHQSGLAHGYYTDEQYQRLNQRLISELERQGVQVECVYHCLHYQNGNVAEYYIK